jgi:hypothetical protein
MKLRYLAIAACLLVIGNTQANAQSATDTSAILGTIQKFFDGMEKRDTASIRETMLPGMRLVSLPAEARGVKPRVQSDTTFLRIVATSPQKFLERMWSPVVKISGPLAAVWTPYDFHLDGKFSHCGVDTFTLVHTETGWLISDLAYTAQRGTGCTPSPLGKP